MSWTFGDPSGMGDQWKAADHVGLLVAFVEPERKEMETKFGSQEATVCRYVVVLDGDDAGMVFDDPIVFGNISRDAYSNGDEKVVLGRVAIGQAKSGQSPPYILNAADDEEKSLAAAWFTQHASLNPAGRILIKEGKL
jgi:hypothetical protein